MATLHKLIVEVVDARNLSPKDGRGASSPYVVVDYRGQRRRTQTKLSDLNPVWNELLDFDLSRPSDVFGDVLELDVYHDKNYGPTTRNNFLGRIRLSSSQFVKKGEEALIYFPLQKKSWFTWIRGDIGLKIYYVDEVVPPPSPPPKAEEPKPETAQPPQSEAVPPPESASPQPTDQPPAEAAPPKEAEQTQPPEPEKPAEEPPTEAAPPPKTEAPEVAESGPSPPPPPPPPPPRATDDANQDQANPPPPPVAPEAAPMPMQLDHEIEVMAHSVSKSMADVKFHRTDGPPPMPRPPVVPGGALNYTSQLEPTESMSMDRPSFDLVEKMHYLFVRVVKARFLPANGSPIVKISTANYHITSKPARKTHCFEWDQTFAFARQSPDQSDASILEVSVWDPPVFDPSAASEVASGHQFLGGICFDVMEIPLRDPPDSPLAPQWYRLEGGGARINGDLMLATWMGTQADDSFPDAWKTDTAKNPNARAKVYQSPKLWYLRATVLEAQDVLPVTASLNLKEATLQVKAQLGFQFLKTEPTVTRNGVPSWNQDLMFVAAEPFSDHLIFTIEHRLPKGPVTLGVLRIPLSAVERRVDDRKVASRWFSFENPDGDEKRMYRGRMHLRLCFDGGYHVMDEAAHVCSDYRPTARQLWKPPLGSVELGVIGCKNLIPVKTVNGKGCTDAYCVAKYGPKWVRTRTVCDSLEPKWNEQYTFKVYDPCTVLSIGVFDNSGSGFEIEGSKDATRPDFRIGKLRVRISTLDTGKVCKNTYPLLVLSPTGLKKMGEVEIAVRFVRVSPTLDLVHVYSQPSLPLMHHIKPLGPVQQDVLRRAAVKIVAAHLSRSEPPLGRDVVLYMLDADSQGFSMRKVRANYFRIINVVAGVMDVVGWINDTRSWKNPMATILVHALLALLVWYPDLIVPTLAFYVFVIGAWNYRFRSRAPLQHFDPKLSLAENVDRDELDEEFDPVPSTRSFEVVRARYDKLRMLGARVQTVLGDFATQGERVQALVTWRDPRATGIFVLLCFVVAVILYMVPSKMVAMAFGFYYLRHPIFRDRMPPPALNFIRRLPSLSDRLL